MSHGATAVGGPRGNNEAFQPTMHQTGHNPPNRLDSNQCHNGVQRATTVGYRGQNEAKRPGLTKLYGMYQSTKQCTTHGVYSRCTPSVAVGVRCRVPWSVPAPCVCWLRAAPPGGQWDSATVTHGLGRPWVTSATAVPLSWSSRPDVAMCLVRGVTEDLVLLGRPSVWPAGLLYIYY